MTRFRYEGYWASVRVFVGYEDGKLYGPPEVLEQVRFWCKYGTKDPYYVAQTMHLLLGNSAEFTGYLPNIENGPSEVD